MNALINADLFRAVYVAVSKEETRYYLQGVYIEPHPVKGVLLTATDGSRLLNAWDEHGSVDAPMIVRLTPDLLKACKQRTVAHRAHVSRLVHIVDGTARIVDADMTAVALGVNDCRVDGAFPKWRNVLPRIDANTPCSPAGFIFNPKLIGDMATVCEALGAATGGPIIATSLYGADAISPVLVHFGKCAIAFGVVMPLQAPMLTDLHALPAYMDANRAQDAIAA